MKKTFFISFILIFTLLLSGCAFPGGDTSAMLTPPALSIGREALTKTMKEVIGEEYELQYPQDGSYRTGIIPVDLDGDEVNEAVCFYRPASTQKLCFLVMKSKEDGSWEVFAKGSSPAASVGRVEFGDMNGDGILEMVVGWHFLSEADGSYEVYTLGGGKAVSRHSGLYSRFILTEGETTRLVVLSRNTATKSVTASLIGMVEKEIALVNTVAMNARGTEFLNIISAKTTKGQPAVYVDQTLDSGQCQTEVLVINAQGELTNELLNQLNAETLRYTLVPCRDNNGDGIPEIPREEALKPYLRNGVEENLYLINWCTFDGATLKSRSYSFLDTAEKFTINFPSGWYGKVTVERQENRTFAFKTLGGEQIFSLRVFGLTEYTEEQIEIGWQKIYEDSDHIYTVLITKKNSMKMDYEKVYAIFNII